MHSRSLRILACALAVCAGAAHAENTLQGLEMDVMEPGESAAHATARIVLPRPRAGVEGSAEYPGLDTEPRVQTGAPDAGGIMGITGDGGGTDAAREGPPVDPGAAPVDPVVEPGG